jgi:hypothetical protein
VGLLKETWVRESATCLIHIRMLKNSDSSSLPYARRQLQPMLTSFGLWE